ncbi:MAG: AbrB/MazE/SpoVT family DNA-binding domain-containing protein [Candidatus Pacearchaeota archaeon]|jgi:phosphate uptake regulator
MRRKVIKQGHNTLTITLPNEWVKRFSIQPGSEVDIIEKDNGLFINSEKNHIIKRAEFDITGMDIPTIWKYFMSIYREGYSEVLVKFEPNIQIDNPYKFLSQHKLSIKLNKKTEKKPIIEALQGFVNRFIGFEIVEHGKDYILIKEMGEMTSKEFDNSLRRVFLLIQEMAEETEEAIRTNNPKILSHMYDVDINLDKFHDYCIRVLNRQGYKETRKTSLLFATLYLLELTGDELRNMSFHLIYDFPNAKLSNLAALAASTKEEIDNFYDLFYKFDKEKIKLISEKDKEMYLNFTKIYKNAPEEEKEIFHHLRMINRYINALLELRIEMEF